MARPTGDDNGRDERGRWKPGNRGGPGGARQVYVRTRARLYEALMREFSADEVRALLRQLYSQALDGSTRAAGLLCSYLFGKPQESMTAREMFPAARVTREPVMSIADVSARIQRLLEDFQAGTVYGPSGQIVAPAVVNP